jgi:CRISPR-associated protein Cmr3
MTYDVIYFEPEDWLAFRDNRAFEVGGTGNISLPKIETFVGALKTAILRKNGIDPTKEIPREYKEIIGDSQTAGKIEIFGPFLFKEDKHYFPIPLGLFEEKIDTEGENKEDNDETKKKYGFMQPHKSLRKEYMGYELNLPWIPFMKDGIEQPEEQLIELKHLENLKTGNLENIQLTKTEELFKVETKVGIKLEKNQKKAEEGKLYSIKTFRFIEGAGFFCFASPETIQLLQGINEIFLGMKQRSVRIRFGKIQTTLFDRLQDGKAALVLLTPSIFKSGFIPKSKRLLDTEIVSAIIGRKQAISGWDISNNQPKPIYHAVPAGSVYFLDGNPQENPFNSKVSDEFSDFGYGKYFVMNWDYIRRDSK